MIDVSVNSAALIVTVGVGLVVGSGRAAGDADWLGISVLLRAWPIAPPMTPTIRVNASPMAAHFSAPLRSFFGPPGGAGSAGNT